MFYLKKDGVKIRVNDENEATRLEADGFVRLTKRQVFKQVIMLNGTVDWLLPVIAATATFKFLLSHDALGFIVGAAIFAFAQATLSPLRIWD